MSLGVFFHLVTNGKKLCLTTAVMEVSHTGPGVLKVRLLMDP